MKYFLSNRQTKELSRGNTIRLAIPAPPNAEVDAEKYLREHVQLPADTIVWAAETIELTVNPLLRAGGGLTELFGQLVKSQNAPPADGLTIAIVCVVANLSNRQQSQQGSQYPTAWPLSVVLSDGRQFPQTAKDDT